jgi:hypothetical protein
VSSKYIHDAEKISKVNFVVFWSMYALNNVFLSPKVGRFCSKVRCFVDIAQDMFKFLRILRHVFATNKIKADFKKNKYVGKRTFGRKSGRARADAS